jgi:hypothetical protein
MAERRPTQSNSRAVQGRAAGGDGARPRRAERPRVMTLEEMASAEPVRATEPEPPEIAELRAREPSLYIASEREPAIEVTTERLGDAGGQGIWRVDVRGAGGRIRTSMPVLQADRIDVRELRSRDRRPETESFRPPWADVEYLPRLLPYHAHLNRLARRRRRGDAPPMQLFHQHNFEALSQSYPWRCVGKVFSFNEAGSTGVGTGVLVGPNLMMTASHMWPWEQPGRSMLFSPGFRDGHQQPTSFVTRVRGVKILDDDDPSGYDYIICRLEQPLGNMLGWMGSKSFGSDDDYYNPRWISNGYPTWFKDGNRPAAEFDVKIVDLDSDDPGLELEVTYNTAMGGGWSGGPLWGVINNDFKIIGIKSGWEVDVYDPARGVFSGGNLMVELIKHGLANFQ